MRIFDFSCDSVGPIVVGMSRAEVRSVVGSKVVEFRKAYFASNTTDAFDDEGIHVYYDDNDIVEAVELFCPNRYNYCGRNVLGERIGCLKDVLREDGFEFETDESGLFLED